MFDHQLFWVSLLGLGAVAVLIGPGRENLLAWVIAVVGAAILHYVAEIPAWSVAGLAVSGAVVAWSAMRGWNPWFVFTPVLGFWVAGKIGGGLPHTGIGWIVFTGFSFALVKIWTLLRDAAAGQAPDVNMATVLAYLFHYPTFIAGPMHYFSEFQESLRRAHWPDGAGWVNVTFRILVGGLKVKVLAPLLQPASLVALVSAQSVTAGQLLTASVVYYAVIYLDFSGYCDLAIGAARAMGLEAPENFDRPYLATNIRDFWQRWHITFSRVLTNFVFVPLSRALTTRTKLGRVPIMVITYTGTFLFCGFWHGSTPNFLLWGLYHAGGLILLDLYRLWVARRRLLHSSSVLPVWRRAAGNMVAIASTFFYVSLGWVPFVLPIDTMLRLTAQLLGS